MDDYTTVLIGWVVERNPESKHRGGILELGMD